MKICEDCKVSKSIEEFYKLSRNKDGRENKCKVCRRIRNNLWYKNNTKKHLASSYPSSIKRKYNISYEEYKDKFKNAICSICFTNQNLCLDHCHKTGKIRDVLCRSCNTALGLFKDDKTIIRKAFNYLEKHE